MSDFQCRRCLERGQDWDGDPPRCAFDKDGNFTADNWNCATMNELRKTAEDRGCVVSSEGQNAALLPWDGRFIALSWYKRRGATDAAYLFAYAPGPLELSDAEEFLS